MKITAYYNGHLVEFVNDKWVYDDTKESIENKRKCPACNKYPTKEGHDACLGTLKSTSFACCGHHNENIEPYIIIDRLGKMTFDSTDEMLKWIKIVGLN